VTGPAGALLVVNAGSSSLKVGQYEIDANGELGAGPSGRLDGIGALGAWLRAQRSAGPLVAVGHRVVHGGTEFVAPVWVDRGVLDALERLVPLAPLHQPHSLAAVRATMTRFMWT
jgi:acetate kinase